ncbi:MAG: nucleoside hydrolase [Bryobacterales bacterium]|nr:nucleoside hydrolase [Bryobacterales bacterium]
MIAIAKTLLAAGVFVTGDAAAERLIIDTDCGYLGDDGTTIAMLLRAPASAKVDAITIVSGNVWSASSLRYTREILKILGQSTVPVYLGADLPLRHTAAMAEEAGRKWGPLEFRGAFGEKKPPEPKLARNAVDEIIRRVEAAPGELTIVALGPMTNIALALRKRPAIASKIRRLVFMGGQLRVPGNASKQAEFNFWFDPEAASAVLQSPIAEKTMFGLDVCNRAMLDKAGFDAIANAGTPLTKRFAEDFGRRYPGFYKNPGATVSLWDALVAAWLISPTLFGAPEKIHLDVETDFGENYGKVLERKKAEGVTPVSMMNTVNYPGVYAMFRDLLTQHVHHH